jgi:hypothetical protein
MVDHGQANVSGVKHRLSAGQATVVLIVVGAAIRVFVAASIGLWNDESYAFSWARHVSLSYYDHPPMTAWLVALMMHLTGDVGPLVIRLPFILLFAGTTWLCFVLGRRLFGAWSGFHAALLMNLSPVFTLSTATCLLPDGPLMFFLLACVWLLTKVLLAPAPRRPLALWVGVGVTFGLAMLSKYLAAFLMFGAGVFLLTRPDRRRWLAHAGPYVAVLAAAAVFSPVLIWNWQHDWVSFRWQTSRGQWSGLRPQWLLLNIGGQAAWLLPWIWGPLVWQLWVCFRAGPADGKRWLIAWLAVGPIVVFTAVSAWARIGTLFHWQMPGYILLFLPLGDAVRRGLERGRALARWWLILAAVFTATAIAGVGSHAVTGWVKSLAPHWPPGKFGSLPDPTVEMLDYTPLPEALAQRGLLGRKDTFAFTNRWFLAGKVDYALKGRLEVLCLNQKDARAYAFFHRQEDWLGKDGILVGPRQYLEDPRGTYGPYFDQIIPMGEVEVRRFGRVEIVLCIYLCRNYRTPFPMPYR